VGIDPLHLRDGPLQLEGSLRIEFGRERVVSAHWHYGDHDDKTGKKNSHVRAHRNLPHLPVAFFVASARAPLSRFGIA
jgi:hypothetical protein